jgi:hypothetical protein
MSRITEDWCTLLEETLRGSRGAAVGPALTRAAWGAAPPSELKLGDNSKSKICGKVFKSVSSED